MKTIVIHNFELTKNQPNLLKNLAKIVSIRSEEAYGDEFNLEIVSVEGLDIEPGEVFNFTNSDGKLRKVYLHNCGFEASESGIFWTYRFTTHA